MATIASHPTSRFSEDVQEMAERLGAAADLPNVVMLTQNVFPGDSVRVEVDTDPDLVDDHSLAVIVRTSLDLRRALEAHTHWHHELPNCCLERTAHLFRLGVEFQE